MSNAPVTPEQESAAIRDADAAFSAHPLPARAPVTPETPRTVAAAFCIANEDHEGVFQAVVAVEFAVTLERELSAVTASLASANEQLAAERAARETAEHWQGDFTEACRQRDQAEARLKAAEEALSMLLADVMRCSAWFWFKTRESTQRAKAALADAAIRGDKP